ncbi:carbamoylphosphate synthase large subunit short form [Rufibacter immobilis]|uniref:Carbamoylphosphate synthase large subunit short form n=1 Tax=Rufibacter immobilis TaxID=1348778 RepID=A0A3M9MZ82_9BACT|nr:ATP-grasp domain-containing protein [Rufibacter immobilis]RNI30859.1 carbamoylphosphate synthase large subunit short form [Rufibacter immobilis]
MKKIKVLIYPCGAENALEVYAAIRHSVHVQVVAATSKYDHSDLIYEEQVFILPNVVDTNFVEEVNDLILQEKIDFIFPTHDTVALYLAKYQAVIKAGVITSDYVTNEICRYKSKTYEVFSSQPFVPIVFNNVIPNEFPIFAKPDVGEGAKGASKISNLEEYNQLQAKVSSRDLVFVEYLPGKEYTIDCFTDRNGKLLFCGARERAHVSMGISFHNKEFAVTEDIKNIADAINTKLSLRGLWFFQLKEDKNGHLKLLEVSTRVASSMGFFRQKGVNFPLLSIFDAMGMNVEINSNEFTVELFRSTTNRYRLGIDYDNVYIDFDDTLIVNNKVNLSLIKFIYQCISKNKRIILITKHAEDLTVTLRKYRISPVLFDEIVVLKLTDRKSEAIKKHRSIFIDNWYLERKEVKEALGIPVFDVDAIDGLLSGY